jgi:DHA3 family tetracycline resistance protein-like MFS transporter
MNRWRVGTVWLAMWATDGFFFHVMSTIFSVFLIVELGLDPLQLVLMGTILEITYLVFEVPTGIVADAVSRKGSIVIGYLGTGVAFLVLASADSGVGNPFVIAAVSQVLWGVSATFISGADVAWLTDEVGEDAARPLYVRGEQYYNGGALLGIAASVALATIAIPLPIAICGVGNLVIGLALIAVMRERRRPSRSEASLGRSMRKTLGEAVRQIRAHHVLLLILATAVLHGASTEGWDRLSDLHFLRGIGLPPLGDLDFVVWFGILDGVALLLGIGALAYVKRLGHLEGHGHVAGVLMVIDVLLIVSVVGFAVAGSFWVAVVLFWTVGALRSVRNPIFTAWLNQGLDTATRATINSIGGQADAVGQALAGPVIGGVARGVSVPWAISIAGLLQVPILLLYVRAIRRGTAGTRAPEDIEQELELAEE